MMSGILTVESIKATYSHQIRLMIPSTLILYLELEEHDRPRIAPEGMSDQEKDSRV